METAGAVHLILRLAHERTTQTDWAGQRKRREKKWGYVVPSYSEKTRNLEDLDLELPTGG